MLKDQASFSLTTQQLVNIFITLNLVIMFFVLFFRKNNSFPNRMLGIILLLPAVSFFGNFYLYSEDLYRFPGFIYINQATSLLGPMLIARYFNIFTGKRSKRTLILHWLTSAAILACLFYLVRFYTESPLEQSVLVGAVIEQHFSFHLLVLRAAFFLLMNLYFLNIAWEVYRYSVKVMNTQADYDRHKVKYLQHFIMILWALNIIVMAAYGLYPSDFIDYYLVPVVTLIFYFFLLRKSFTSNAVFSGEQLAAYRKELSEIDRITDDGPKNIIPPEKLDALKLKATELIDIKKVFTDPALNLVKFSAMLEQPPHVVSAFINQHLKTNFFNLVNSKRIELAKEKFIRHGSRSEIEVIAYEVGFNSKSAFYRAFGKFTSQSPSGYIDSLK
jgi:AraC-like DNA-binding protein